MISGAIYISSDSYEAFMKGCCSGAVNSYWDWDENRWIKNKPQWAVEIFVEDEHAEFAIQA